MPQLYKAVTAKMAEKRGCETSISLKLFDAKLSFSLIQMTLLSMKGSGGPEKVNQKYSDIYTKATTDEARIDNDSKCNKSYDI